MAVYSGVVRSLTPLTTDDNWSLAAGASESCEVFDVHWGGEVTASAAMMTRVARSSGQAGAVTAGNVAKAHPYSVTNVIAFGLTYATTQPTLDAGDLFGESWNAHGGVVRWLADRDREEFILIGATAELVISCRNAVGTSVSTYGVAWEEN